MFPGKIEASEVKTALAQLGVNVDLAEAEKLTQRCRMQSFSSGNLANKWFSWVVGMGVVAGVRNVRQLRHGCHCVKCAERVSR